LLVRREDIQSIQAKVQRCLDLALEAIGGRNTILGRELGRLATEFEAIQTMEELQGPLLKLRGYLKDIQ
jgi:hypothetical protein